jgi:imidazoleglycerol-phosphate dehydratase
MAEVRTGERFLDHLLVTLARYSALDLTIEADGDLRHHVIEDVAITLGAAVRRLVPETAVRYGESTVPMDDALVQAVLDTGGRPYYRGPLPSSLYEHWMRSFCDHAAVTLHLRILRGEDRHHIVEAAFKALGFALRAALSDSGAVFSTKGSVSVERR